MTGFIGGQQLVPQAQKDSTTTSSADKIPTTGEDPGTALKARKTFAETDPRRVDTSTQTPSAPAPVKISTQRVAQNLNISTDAAAQLENTNPTLYNLFGDTSTTAGFTPADIETMPLRDRLMLENIASGKVTASGVETPSSEITTPSAAGENVVVGVDSSTGDALIISDSGVVSTVKVDPNTKTGTSVFYDPQARLIINPTTNTITSIDTNITSRVDSPAIKTAIDTATKTQTKTDTSTSTKTSPVDKTKTEEVLFPKTPVTTPVTSPPTTPDPVAPVADTPTKKTPRFSFQTPPSTSPVPETQKDPSLITDPSDTSSTKEKAPSKYKPNINVSTSKTLSKTPDKSSILSEALSTTTGLTAFRGAGEIEGQQTGKPRKNVWNEESLRLKDALGV
jgi:co-chaperonin GroES (HSP10)